MRLLKKSWLKSRLKSSRQKRVAVFRGLVLVSCFCLPTSALCQTEELGSLVGELSRALNPDAEAQESTATFSGRLIQMFLIISVISIAPGLLIVMTSFTRFVVVFSMLRSALGLNQTPPNIVLNAMALFMTIFVMQPVFDDSWQKGLDPLLRNQITEQEAIERIAEPFRNFMIANTRDKDLQLFLDFSRKSTDRDKSVQEIEDAKLSFRVLIPSFMISEIRRAFTIGFLVFLPFIAIDLIIASVLMSAGMMMLPPVIVSLPFKIIFFVLIDGWYLLAGSLMESYIPYSGLN